MLAFDVEIPLTQKEEEMEDNPRAMINDVLLGVVFETFGCMIYGYCVCNSQYYRSSIDRSNAGSFFVSYGLFLSYLLFGDIAQGHFNGAVSMAMFLKRNSKFTAYKLAAYLVPQVLGFWLGGMLAWGLQDRIITPNDIAKNFPVQNFFAEILGTFMFVFFLILLCSDISPTRSKMGIMFLIGLVLFIFRTWAFRTQALNPSMVLGLGLAAGIRTPASWTYWRNSWVIILGPLIGAFLAPLFFDYFFRPMHRLYQEEQLKRQATALP